jgi:hypothetical protein
MLLLSYDLVISAARHTGNACNTKIISIPADGLSTKQLTKTALFPGFVCCYESVKLPVADAACAQLSKVLNGQATSQPAANA